MIDKPADRSSLFPAKVFIDGRDIRRLTQAGIFLADSVWVSATTRIDPRLSPEDQETVARRFQELIDLGMIRTWEVEGQAAFLEEIASGRRLISEPTLVVPRERFLELHGSLIERLADTRVALLGRDEPDSFDGITEVVLGKHTLANFALRDMTGARDMLLDSISAASVKGYMDPLLSRSQILEGTISEVGSHLELPDLSILTPKQIEDCRSLMPAFRSDLLARTDELSALTTVDEAIRKLTEQLLDEQQAASLNGRGGWALGRLTIPEDALRRLSDRFFGWSTSTVVQMPPEMLLLRLRALADQSA